MLNIRYLWIMVQYMIKCQLMSSDSKMKIQFLNSHNEVMVQTDKKM